MVKDHPADAHQQKCPDMPQHARQAVPLQQAEQERLLRDEQDQIKQAPQDKIPRSPVPQSRQQPYNGKVEVLTCPSAAVAAERDVHVLPEPGGQRDVPAPPEIRDAGRHIGVAEVLRELKAEHTPQSDCHIRISGEIKVNMQGIRCHHQPAGQYGEFKVRRR